MNKKQILKMVEENFDQMIEQIQKLVSINSTFDASSVTKENPFGNNIANVFKQMEEIMVSDGINFKNYDNYVLEVNEFEEASKQNFGAMVHLDTVPLGNWSISNPLNLTLIENKYYGRGSSDNKGPAIMIYTAYKLWKSLNLKPKFNFKLVFGGDEERNWDDFKHYFKHAKDFDIGISPDTNLPPIYLEKSMSSFRFSKMLKKSLLPSDITLLEVKSGSVINVVPDHCVIKIACKNQKIVEKVLSKLNKEYYEQDGLELLIEFNGKAAHAKEPNLGVNAAWKAFEFLKPLKLDKNASDFIIFANNYFESDCYGRKLGIYQEDEHSFATNNLAIVNYNQSSWNLDFNFRASKDNELEIINAKLAKIAELFKLDFKVLAQKPIHYVSKDSDFMNTLISSYDFINNEKLVPGVNGGRTYASVSSNTIAFGPHKVSDKTSIHSNKENISKETIINMTAVYLQMFIELSYKN